ncbi:endolytic transglycosylase MltG [Maribellus sp. CM-23]|uniref:endolytic transglycosylase MltG n=1 Tax=Maribellus sp. CM-23 TaxID=2781026 RepID=UPI001F35BA6D|nr:endolytic transglycosylase MltG [Maribellus sp. CM-23]MCE4565387.1 endolytic transglycosylase MltG [Maribellus sp. CM-23]
MTFPKIGKFIIIFFAIAVVIVGARAYKLYHYTFDANVKTDYVLLIGENQDFEAVYKELEKAAVLVDNKAFRWVSDKKSYPSNVKPGRYILKTNMTTNALVNKLRSGNQDPVDVTFNNIRIKEDLAGKVSKYLWADSLSILQLFANEQEISERGFDAETYRTMFIPNTYEMYWTTDAEEFGTRMYREYERFWNEDRKNKAKTLELTPVQVSILASVVESETAKADELKWVAGLYINRLRRNIPLQADPTIKYAVGDFSLRRILNKHLEIDSPYNTYKYAGLPPGPICFPSVSSIDAVLNYEKHDFIYMCAKEDFSGYHNFAKTLAQHNRNAAKYRTALDKNRIYK